MKIKSKILVIGVSVPVLFSLLCQLGEFLESIFENITIFVNITTFTTFLLVFLTSMIISYLIQLNLKEGIITGILIGFLAEIISLFLIILFALIMQSLVGDSQVDILTEDFIYYYVVPNLIFQAINGAIGAFIGVQLHASIKNH